ncbi:hypothetical protein [Saccharothrix hoggarensis]|uniref:Uncharacterized protein n=1 Tax=Saccharothrix hoggarensis TaxID=913853 RepID=A0ABW3QRG3_9PSEU
MPEFLATGDDRIMELLTDTADAMAAEFGLSRAEAVARVNEYWSTRQDLLDDGLPTHEEAEYWASFIYYAEGTPFWRKDADRSAWRPRPAPAEDSGFWTV